MRRLFFVAMAVGLMLPAPASQAKAQEPIGEPNAFLVIPGDPCEGCIWNVCNCVKRPPIIIS